ncbi:MAG: MarR family transcriptional regulator [Erythrobacter sp.]|nr:MarR family transcriptional regulator [Erythrobacter sp.]
MILDSSQGQLKAAESSNNKRRGSALSNSHLPKAQSGSYEEKPVAQPEAPENTTSIGSADACGAYTDASKAFNAPRLMLGANDGPVDDFLNIVDHWEEIAGHSLMPDPVSQATEQAIASDEGRLEAASKATEAQNVLGQIATDFSAQQMRQLGASLLRLADSIDQAWEPSQVKSTYHWITKAGRIERHALELAKVAVQARLGASRRTRHLSAEFLGEPAWEMLLELFIQFAGGAKVSTKSLCAASGLSDTTALRLIDRLDSAGLVERSQSPVDKRVTLVALTRQGVQSVGSILIEMES